jgi:5'-3' exonuclease
MKTVTPIIVFDGSRNPIKQEDAARRTKSDETKTQIGKMLMDPKTDQKELYKLMKSGATIDENIVAMATAVCNEQRVEYLCSHSEADSQCIALEKAGVVGATLTVDSDFFVLGARVLILMTSSQLSQLYVKLEKLSPSSHAFACLQ